MTNSKFLTSDQLIDRWKIQKFDLLDLVIRNEIPRYTTHSLEPWTGADDMFSLMNTVFRLADIETFEQKHPEYQPCKLKAVVITGWTAISNHLNCSAKTALTMDSMTGKKYVERRKSGVPATATVTNLNSMKAEYDTLKKKIIKK